jgi:hypothetical protein
MLDTRQPFTTTDPGQLAYVAYWRVLAPLALPWERISDDEQAAWRAAATAARRGHLRAVPRARKETP